MHSKQVLVSVIKFVLQRSSRNNECSSLSPLPELLSASWREKTLCVKRGGDPAGFYRNRYHGRPHPNKHGHCPKGYKKCGDGMTQQQAAICFPADSECPITNLRVVPSSLLLSAAEGWEPAGQFQSDNFTLYTRREHIGELPVVNITVALSEVAGDGNQLRGLCYDGVCETTDPRWTLFDSLALEEYFLKSVEASVPSCEQFQLYSLSDPRYNRSLDPDYLHSGVPCGVAPQYAACVRDSFQHTDCAAGDSICDGVVHQNICGEYARAVRSAFADSPVSMGLHFTREIDWSDSCGISKATIFRYTNWINGACFCFVFTLMPVVGLVMVVVGFALLGKVFGVYLVLESYQCTDAFTHSSLVNRLRLIPLAFCLALTCMVVGISTYAVLFADIPARPTLTPAPTTFPEVELTALPAAAQTLPVAQASVRTPPHAVCVPPGGKICEEEEEEEEDGDAEGAGSGRTGGGGGRDARGRYSKIATEV